MNAFFEFVFSYVCINRFAPENVVFSFLNVCELLYTWLDHLKRIETWLKLNTRYGTRYLHSEINSFLLNVRMFIRIFLIYLYRLSEHNKKDTCLSH